MVRKILNKTYQVMVIGNKGMLGQELMLYLKNAGIATIGFDLPDLDITRPKAVSSCFKQFGPDIVINCAAYTAVDKAESEPDEAFAVNRDGAANLADSCKDHGIPLIHISTDYVFDGKAKRPYKEDDPVNPLGVYGLSKGAGEEAVRMLLAEHLIVRTSWLYGVHGNNFVKTILRLAREREELKVVADQFGCPTWTGDLAAVVVAMVSQIHENRKAIRWGTYHFCNSGSTTWYGFARAIVNKARLRENLRATEVIPIATPDYPTPAQRPKWCLLDCTKIRNLNNIQPRPWEEALEVMLAQLYDAKPL